MIYFKKINEVYSKIVCDDDSLMYELADEFARFVQNYQHTPKFKQGKWDGKIRYINRRTGNFYSGLLKDIWLSCKRRGYNEFKFTGYTQASPYDEKSILDRLEALGLPYDLYDYQITAIIESLTEKRRILLSPTSSGKSTIIYCIARILAEDGLKVLIQVPSVMLANQLESDFNDYARDDVNFVENNVHKIYAGVTKNSDKPIYISTWQSINALAGKDKDAISDYMSQFDCVINDEVHQSGSDVLKGLMENAVNASYRIGLTGTLDEVKSMMETLNGLFGKTVRVKTTKQLMDEGKVTKLKIHPLVLSYEDFVRKHVAKLDYQEELSLVIRLKNRNKFICDLANSVKGNTVILVRHISKHAKPLEEYLLANSDKTIILIDKDTKADIREETRKQLETIDNAIIIASYALMGTGVSIKSLTNIIFAAPLKSKIPVIQSIGRILRLHNDKEVAHLFDIVDDLTWKGKDNFFMEHFKVRYEYYVQEDFETEIKNFNIKVGLDEIHVAAIG